MGAVVMVFTGEYDLSHKAELRRELLALRDENYLVLDMSAVSYIDSTCVSELMSLQDYRTKEGLAQVCIVQKARSVRRIFDVLKLGTMFRINESLDEVLPRDGNAVVIQHAAPGDNSAVELSEAGRPKSVASTVPTTFE